MMCPSKYSPALQKESRSSRVRFRVLQRIQLRLPEAQPIQGAASGVREAFVSSSTWGECNRTMIEIKDITKTYGSGEAAFQALKGVSFTIKDGEFVAIMGPSGSGKSTLMHMLGCLDTPTSGSYFLDGKDISTLTDEELADIRRLHVGFVFQAFNLLPRTSVLRNVMLPLVYAGVNEEERVTRSEKALIAAG